MFKKTRSSKAPMLAPKFHENTARIFRIRPIYGQIWSNTAKFARIRPSKRCIWNQLKNRSITSALTIEIHPIGIVHLLEKLGSTFSERSVRRWLSELVDEGLVERSGQKRGTKYSFLQRSDRNTKGNEHLFGMQSKRTIERVHRPLFERTPVSYDSRWFESYNLYKRGIIESVNAKLKIGCQIDHHRHRSLSNFLVTLISGLVSYSLDPRKPRIGSLAFKN